MVYWAPRGRELVMEEDLIPNFELMKEYVPVVGHETPLPHQLDHEASCLHYMLDFFMANPARLFQICQAALILLSVTFNLHSGVYDVRGGRKIIRDPYLNSFPEKIASIRSVVLPARIRLPVQNMARGLTCAVFCCFLIIFKLHRYICTCMCIYHV